MQTEIKKVQLVEVGPRDGLQNDPTILDPDARIEFITRLVDAGIRRIEAVSFVNDKRVPAMAGAEAVMAGVPRGRGVSYIGLALNPRGFERAVLAGVDEVNYVVCASDTFNQRNQGAPRADTLASMHDIARRARDAKLPCSLSIATAFGCPFEGEVDVAIIRDIARQANDAGIMELGLADTIGVASPFDVKLRVAAAREAAPGVTIRCHFHNTRNTGIANAYAAIEAGVAVLDASTAGIGGCPFAPKATGNIGSEDLLYMLHRMGIETGVDLPKLITVAKWLEGTLGHATSAQVSRAGLFPVAA
ncbi:MAG: hydroxymethylglutaryl-CoA lyase [Alphaproteobacteria bacterium]|nr:hydroxymethylglutaryl-CoA lyase [Alphaproteobacteria bacterium]